MYYFMYIIMYIITKCRLSLSLVYSLQLYRNYENRNKKKSKVRSTNRKVTEYFRPSFNMFSRLELETEKTREVCRVGCYLIDFLVASSQLAQDTEKTESVTLLDDLVADIMNCVQEVLDSASPHDCVFSPTRLSNSACQLYFLFIG